MKFLTKTEKLTQSITMSYHHLTMASAAARKSSFPTKYISTTPAVMRCEAVTLAALNKRLVEEEVNYYFNNYDEFKDIHDNSGEDRETIFQLIGDELYEYLTNTITNRQFDVLFSELDVKDDVLSKYTSPNKDILVLCAQHALEKIFVHSPSARQLRMMQLEME